MSVKGFRGRKRRENSIKWGDTKSAEKIQNSGSHTAGKSERVGKSKSYECKGTP